MRVIGRCLADSLRTQIYRQLGASADHRGSYGIRARHDVYHIAPCRAGRRQDVSERVQAVRAHFTSQLLRQEVRRVRECERRGATRNYRSAGRKVRQIQAHECRRSHAAQHSAWSRVQQERFA